MNFPQCQNVPRANKVSEFASNIRDTRQELHSTLFHLDPGGHMTRIKRYSHPFCSDVTLKLIIHISFNVHIHQHSVNPVRPPPTIAPKRGLFAAPLDFALLESQSESEEAKKKEQIP
jgi:hypothetical protein